MYKDEEYEKILAKDIAEVSQLKKLTDSDPENAEAFYKLGLCYKEGKGVLVDYEEAFNYFITSYNINQNPEAARLIGIFYYQGFFVEKDIEQAMTMYQYAHEMGDKTATTILNVLDVYGYEIESNEWNIAFANLTVLANEGNSFAQYSLGELYNEGLLGYNEEIAKKYFLDSVQTDNAYGAVQLGYIYLGQHEQHAYEKAVELYKFSAYKHNANGMYNLGSMYDNGRGVEQNDEAAFYWFTKAAERGQANAMLPLYYAYTEANIIEADEDYAMELLYQAAEAGVDAAQLEYGNIQSDEGPYLNYQNAYYWFQMAAEQGNIVAINNLGWMHENGHGVEQDYAKAIHFFYQAAEAGYAVSQCNVGRYYLEERGGMPKDLEEAKKWLKLSAEQGYEKANNLLEEIENTPSKGNSFWNKLLS